MVGYNKKGGACCGRKPNKKKKNKTPDEEQERIINPRFESYISPEPDSYSDSESDFPHSRIQGPWFITEVEHPQSRRPGTPPLSSQTESGGKRSVHDEVIFLNPRGNLKKNKRKSKKKRKRTVKRKKRKSKKTKRRNKFI
tara:strand:+ start:186 stop:605 length:420 start_codon:yes stop_codon:yes gene_type:complete